jgi:peptidoglycan hydrolase-like protein with peptidoglycan-binding domain
MTRTSDKRPFPISVWQAIAGSFCFVCLGAISFNALMEQEGQHPAPLWASKVAPSDDHTLSASSLSVTHIQHYLARLGYYEGAIDGLAGPQTRSAIEAYQKRHELDVTGTTTEAFLHHVRQGLGTSSPSSEGAADFPVAAVPAPLPVAVAQEGAKLQEHDRQLMTASLPQSSLPDRDQASQMVARIQWALTELGYAPGTIDGVLGQTTRDAIKRFELDRAMTPSGQASDRLVKELQSVMGTALPQRVAF